MLRALSEYSAAEIAQACAASPAFARYFPWTQLQPSSDTERLRYVRHQAWCRCVMATFFQTASAADVCTYWSKTADEILLSAWRMAQFDADSVSLFALGKLGSQELNLSSDVDLLIVAQPQEVAAAEKKLRLFRTLIHQSDDRGFCFRLDFDLRPGGTMGPLIVTPSQFQDYYWAQGEAWERLALVRLRVLTPKTELSESIMDLANRFSYRKFLDYSLLEDLKALRSQIHQFSFNRSPEQTHLKLEVGGIRDIELFIHSLLVLNGGKVEELKIKSTEGATKKLMQHNLLAKDEAQLLGDSYWYFRQLENQIQAHEDQQTHSLNWQALPKHWNWPNREALQFKLDRVNDIVSGLLGKVDISTPQLPQTPSEQEHWLGGLGYSPEVIGNVWPQLISATALSHKNDRDERARKQFLFTFLQRMSTVGLDQNLGMHLLYDFVRATRAKATFFSLLLRETRLLDDLARMFCSSPYLGAILSARPELIDNFILLRNEEWHQDFAIFIEQASEMKLLNELRAANSFLHNYDLQSLLLQTSATADTICKQLLERIKHEVGSTNLQILTLGKWGGREMGLRSDLDFIFVTETKPMEADFKAARRFVSRLTDPQKGGVLYGMDLRLRPSGQSGAILVSTIQLENYWAEEAQAWERQAYLRTRLLEDGLTLNKSKMIARGLSHSDLKSLEEIRGKLLKFPDAQSVDLKYCPGGLIDIEFVVQTSALNAKQVVSQNTLSMLSEMQFPEKVSKAYNFVRTLEQLLQLGASHLLTKVEFQSEYFERACALWKKSPSHVQEELEHHLQVAIEALNKLDPTGYRRN